MSERDELIKELRDTIPLLDERDGSQRPIYDIEMELIVNFILKDRRRIVEPLVELKNKVYEDGYEWSIDSSYELAIDKTLKNAGEI